MMLGGRGFLVLPGDPLTGPWGIVRAITNGADLLQNPRGARVIDFFGLSVDEARERAPEAFQRVLDRVKPERDANRRATRRERWWIFSETMPATRRLTNGLRRYIATPETSKHRLFTFVDGAVLPEHPVLAIGLEDAFFLGALSSRVHLVWALSTGGRLGVGNDPRYNKTRCFEPFPFPDCPDGLRSRIRELAESLDNHRKTRQAQHADLTITAMYNVLEKLRSGEPLTAKEKVVHDQGLVSVLKKLHDDLDGAVFDAYGWPQDLADEQILERLVALNKERAEEEKRGLVRWLRPEFQNPSSKPAPMKQVEMPAEPEANDEEEQVTPKTKATILSWPKKLAEQIAIVRDVVTKSSAEWSAEDVAANFKGAKTDDVSEVLDSLAALGLLVTYELVEGQRWRASAFVSVRPPPS